MTAVPLQIDTSDARLAPLASPGPLAAQRTLLHRYERLLLAAGLCLPIPLLSMTSFSLPLPATVERLAAALVPWGDETTLDANEALAAGSTGAIVRAAGERLAAQAEGPDKSAMRVVFQTSQQRGEGSGSVTLDGSKQATTGKKSGDGDDGGDGGGGEETPSPSPGSGGTEPAPAADPIQGAVDTVTDTAHSTVDETVTTATDVVDTGLTAVDGLLSGK
jgi:hypothetical protein